MLHRTITWPVSSRFSRSRASGKYLPGRSMEPILPNSGLSGKPGGIQTALAILTTLGGIGAITVSNRAPVDTAEAPVPSCEATE